MKEIITKLKDLNEDNIFSLLDFTLINKDVAQNAEVRKIAQDYLANLKKLTPYDTNRKTNKVKISPSSYRIGHARDAWTIKFEEDTIRVYLLKSRKQRHIVIFAIFGGRYTGARLPFLRLRKEFDEKIEKIVSKYFF